MIPTAFKFLVDLMISFQVGESNFFFSAGRLGDLITYLANFCSYTSISYTSLY